MNTESIQILDVTIKRGTSHRLDFNRAQLYNASTVEVPVLINSAKKPGPVVLLMGGLHGDEVNGIEVVRQLIAKGYTIPVAGTIICMPILNIFGFLSLTREFPDGRDLNRSFPGFKTGSLAGRFAYQFVHEILPHVDLVMDYHTGGAQRFNAPQLRVESNVVDVQQLAQVFCPPFIIHAKKIKGTLRATCSKLKKPYLLFEGGKSGISDKSIIKEAVEGSLRVLKYLKMIDEHVTIPQSNQYPIHIHDSKWHRAAHSGMFHPKIPYGNRVEKGEFIATITDPYGSFRHKVKASHAGYVINVNHSPMVYQGDAIFHISKHG